MYLFVSLLTLSSSLSVDVVFRESQSRNSFFTTSDRRLRIPRQGWPDAR